MWFYYAIYSFLVVAFYFAIKYERPKSVFIGCIVLLICIAGFRPSTCCRDYLNYVDYYYDIDTISSSFLEPTFFFISKISQVIFDSPLGIFLIYAIMGVSTKGLAFIKLSNFYLLSLILYFSTFFLLHEMTQIRVGIASSVLLLSIPSIYERNWFKFFLLILAGTLFHYSFLIFIFFYFLNPYKINPLFYIGLLVFGFLTYLSGVNIVSLLTYIPISFISEKVEVYNNLREMGVDTEINVFNILVILRIGILSVFLWKWPVLYEKNRYSIILIKIYAFSIFFFVFLSSLPVMAFRVRELLGIVEIILVPFFIYLIKEKYIAFIITLLIGLLLMSIEIWYNGIINNYF